MCSNLRGEPDSLDELLADKILTAALLGAGFLPFGRPADGGYDRICFYVRKKSAVDDAAVVRLAHEPILSFGRIPRPLPVAENFARLLATAAI